MVEILKDLSFFHKEIGLTTCRIDQDRNQPSVRQILLPLVLVGSDKNVSDVKLSHSMIELNRRAGNFLERLQDYFKTCDDMITMERIW
jgi:hypothetical protein